MALQTTTPKVSPKRLMSLDHKSEMRWCTSGFVVILCKYGFLFKKPLAMSVRVVIWAVSFDSLCEPDPYVDVDNIMGYDPNWWKRNVDHESTSWSKDLTGHVSPIHVVEWNMSLFWALIDLPKNSIIYWCGMSCQWNIVPRRAKKESSTAIKMNSYYLGRWLEYNKPELITIDST